MALEGRTIIPRRAEAALRDRAAKFPAVTLTGPRQSGKTTLARTSFPDYECVSMENPDVLRGFEDDLRSFLARYSARVILDEAQRAPELFSYLQLVIDVGREPGRFVLTGSQDFLRSKATGQSLAGRVASITLLPLSLSELLDGGHPPATLEARLLRGGFPRIYDASNAPEEFFPGYVRTYLERDVRDELGVRKLRDFTTFVGPCATRTSQQLNVSALARDAGVAFNTAKEWPSVLEASGVVHLLPPYLSNRGKSLVKSPKLYFLDTGLVAYLIGARSTDEPLTGGFRGPLFETFVVSEVLKAGLGRGADPQLSYWRDGRGSEVDLVVSRGAAPRRGRGGQVVGHA